MDSGKRVYFGLFSALALLLLAGCGDPPTNDHRGYTKAPLERPNLVIHGEGSSAMDSLGSPILPRDTVIAAEQIAAPPKR